MKVSKYTFLFIFEEKYYAYNTLSNSLLELDSEAYNVIESFESKQSLDTSVFPEDVLKELTCNKIITENDDDDYLLYKSTIDRMRKQRDSMHLTLAPTMDCCFKCHYCFEKYKEKNYMTESVMSSIIKYISGLSELKSIRLTWFGGEPLMAVPQMDMFYTMVKDVWGEKNFSSNIITTGYHINEKVIEVLKKIQVSSMQITLDGLKDSHNKVKFLNECPNVFDKVIENIDLISEKAPEISIIIRVNLTKANMSEYVPLYKMVVNRFKGRNVSIAPAFVLDRGITNDNSDDDDIFFTPQQESDFILNLAASNIDSPFIRYPKPFFSECAIRNDMAISFDPEGYAYKCWEIIGNKEYAIGKLNEDGRLYDVNLKELNRQLYGADPLDDPKCMQCKYLPICCGGCPIQRIENKFNGKCNNTCIFYKGRIEEFLKIHIKRTQSGIYNY